MKLTISEAARRAGVKRQVLYRKMEKGSLSKEISEDGNPVIDLSELVRIYPQAATYTGQSDRTVEQSGGQLVTEVWQKENAFLHERIASLEADKAALRRDLDHERNEASTNRDKLLALLERHIETVRLLTDQRAQASAQPKRSLWQRFIGLLSS